MCIVSGEFRNYAWGTHCKFESIGLASRLMNIVNKRKYCLISHHSPLTHTFNPAKLMRTKEVYQNEVFSPFIRLERLQNIFWYLFLPCELHKYKFVVYFILFYFISFYSIHSIHSILFYFMLCYELLCFHTLAGQKGHEQYLIQ